MASLSKHVSQLYGLALYTINSQQYIIQLQTTQYIPFNFVDRATGVSIEDAFNNLCKCIAEQYPVV